MVRTALVATLLCALTPSLAYAQLYAWTDPSGALIISKSPRNTVGQTYQVFSPGSQSTAYRAGKPASARAAQFEALISTHAAQNSLSPDFVRAVIQAESAFNPFARSPKGAMGLMQLMPRTAADYGVTDAYDPAQNIRGGVAYLKSLMTRFNDNVSLALAAYNAGPGAVEKYGNTVPPYKETLGYVSRIRGNMDVAHAVNNRSALYQVVTVVDGQRSVKYYDKPRPGATLVTTAR